MKVVFNLFDPLCYSPLLSATLCYSLLLSATLCYSLLPPPLLPTDPQMEFVCDPQTIRPPLTPSMTMRCSVRRPAGGRPDRLEEELRGLAGIRILKDGRTAASVSSVSFRNYTGPGVKGEGEGEVPGRREGRNVRLKRRK